MKTKSTIVSVVALMSALSFAIPAYAQDTGAQTGTDTQTQAGTQTGTDAGAGTDTGGAGADTSGGTQTGTDTQGGATVDQGGAQAGGDVNVDVTTEQQTQIRTAITEVNVAPVTDIDIDITNGVVIPQTIKLQPLPATVIAIVPQFEGYLFFLLPDGRIVIVAPDTLKVVYILSA
jgi:hypothetical protein